MEKSPLSSPAGGLYTEQCDTDQQPPTGLYPDDSSSKVVDIVDDPTIPKTSAKRTLTWWRLAMITFVFTCAGPGGLEQVVIAGGPLMALLGIFVVPLLYVMPQIFVVSELGAMMPTAAGNVVWVHRAFGRFAGFYNAWIFALTNMVDMAVYPVLFGDYVVSSYHPDANYGERMAYRLSGLLVGILISLLSAKDVSNVAAGMSVAVVVFVVIAFCGSLPNLSPKQWTHVTDDIDYSLMGSSLLWLYTGWTALGAMAGETVNSRVLLHGMSSALAIDMTVYLIALLAALTVAKQDEWEDGYFVTAFNRIIPGMGPYFGAIVIATSLGLLVSAVTCYARMVWGMAEMGWAPRFLARQLPTGSPHFSIFFHAIVAFSLVWFDFGFIVRVEYTVAATSYLLTYAAFLRLRYTEPDAPRPYVVPGGMPFAWVITGLKFVVMGATMIAGLIQDWRIVVATVGTNVAVLVGYAVYRKYHPDDTPIVPLDSSASAVDDGGGASRRHTMDRADDTAQGATLMDDAQTLVAAKP